MKIIVEIAVDTLRDAVAAAQAGADRIELCSALDQDGLTPSIKTLRRLKQATRVPVACMVRPRAGDFRYSAEEVHRMAEVIDALVDAGAEGLVFGAINSEGVLDVDACRILLGRCRGRESVFHRAFDRAPDLPAALETLIDLGFTRVLTSGGAARAADEPGVSMIRRLNQQAAGRITILPGGGVRADNAARLIMRTGCREVHSSCRVNVRGVGALFDAKAVRALREAVESVPGEHFQH